MKTLLLLASLFPLAALAGDPPPPPGGQLDVKVTNVQENMAICACDRVEFLGRICIAATKYKAADLHLAPPPSQQLPQESLYGQTTFEARIDGKDVVLTSVAYYEQCTYGLSPVRYTNSEYEDLIKDQKVFGIAGLNGIAPYMQAAFVNADGSVGQFSQPIRGMFAEEKLYSEKDADYEASRTEYPGTVELRRPIFGFLTDSQIRVVLDGDVLKRYVKVWLSIQRAQGFTSFGEYTVTLKFFRKPGTKLKDIWDTSVIGVELLPQQP